VGLELAGLEKSREKVNNGRGEGGNKKEVNESKSEEVIGARLETIPSPEEEKKGYGKNLNHGK